MMTRTAKSLFVFTLILPLAMAMPAGADQAQPQQAAKQFIQDLGQRAIDSLTGPDLSNRDLRERFRELFREGFDVEGIARSALGRYWHRASDPQRKEYVQLFEDYVVEIYARRFRAYSGETLSVDDARDGPGPHITVNSKVERPEGKPPAYVQWIVSKADSDFKIRDVVIEGASMVATQRDEFASVITRGGGEVSALLDALRAKTEDLSTARVEPADAG